MSRQEIFQLWENRPETVFSREMLVPFIYCIPILRQHRYYNFHTSSTIFYGNNLCSVWPIQHNFKAPVVFVCVVNCVLAAALPLVRIAIKKKSEQKASKQFCLLV